MRNNINFVMNIYTVGYATNAEQALIVVKDVSYNSDSQMGEYHLGNVLEHVKREE